MITASSFPHFLLPLALAGGCLAQSALQDMPPMVIEDQDGVVILNARITSTNGPCITIRNSRDVIIRNSEIGPCGTRGGQKHGIKINNSGYVSIIDSYIHPEYRAPRCCDTGNGVMIDDSYQIEIRGNVIAYSETNIEAHRNVNNLRVTGNFLLNPLGAFPRGQHVQAWYSQDVVVEDNYMLASRDEKYAFAEGQEDAINFGNGVRFTARNNYIRGGQGPGGCGVMADIGADETHVLNNVIVDTGNCAIGVASGVNNVIDGNRALVRNPVPGSGNTALYVWKQYDRPCGPTQVTNNISTTIRENGQHSGWWNGGGCGPVSLQDNVFNEAAKAMLDPVDLKHPAPMIPPKPQICAVNSPWTNNMRYPSCH